MKKTTGDGSLTLYSKEFGEHYHSLSGAYQESLNKFILPSGLLNLMQSSVSVLDVGFGLGYNSFTLLQEAKKHQMKTYISALEFSKTAVEQSREIHNKNEVKILDSLLETNEYSDDLASITMYWGDARRRILDITDSSQDAVFLDPFSPPKNPELWTLQFFQELYRVISPSGVLLTYSSALPVISALLKAGFYVGYTPPHERRRGGIFASKASAQVKYPLSDEDLYYLQVSARAVPNIDKNHWDKDEIQGYRSHLMLSGKESGIKLPHKKCGKIFKDV